MRELLRTIWSLIVLPSSSIVRIFCSTTVHTGYRVSTKPAFPRALGLSNEGDAAHEVDTDRTDVAVSPLVVLRRQRSHVSAPEQQNAGAATFFLRGQKAHRKAQEQARLADARVADQHENEQVVICEQELRTDLLQNCSVTA